MTASEDLRRSEAELVARLKASGVPEKYTQAVLDAIVKPVEIPATVGAAGPEMAVLRDAGIGGEVFGLEAQRRNALWVAQAAVAIEAELRHSSLTTRQVAELLGADAGDIGQMLSEGELMAAGRIGGELVYPAWQVAGG